LTEGEAKIVGVETIKKNLGSEIEFEAQSAMPLFSFENPLDLSSEAFDQNAVITAATKMSRPSPNCPRLNRRAVAWCLRAWTIQP